MESLIMAFFLFLKLLRLVYHIFTGKGTGTEKCVLHHFGDRHRKVRFASFLGQA